MSQVFEVNPHRLSEATEALDAATDAIGNGDLVVLPTETVYGIAARPDLDSATSRLFEAKRRPERLTLPVLTASTEDAWSVGRLSPAAKALAAVFWPGPLTMVLRRTDRSGAWRLGTEGETIGVRVPGHTLTRALLDRTGPLAVTSANVSGMKPISSLPELRDAFGESVAVYMVLDQETEHRGAASTVVDLTGPRPKILRRGPIDEPAILAAVGG